MVRHVFRNSRVIRIYSSTFKQNWTYISPWNLVHLWVLREQTHFSARTILISFESLWQVGGIPLYWKKAIACFVFLKEKKEYPVPHGPVRVSPFSDGSNGLNPLQEHFPEHEGQESNLKSLAGISKGEIMRDQFHRLLWWSDSYGGWGESIGYCSSYL